MKVNNPIKFGYPVDNSFCVCLTDNNIDNPLLAGNHDTKRKLVGIVSSPYMEEIDTCNGKKEYEFINVWYEGNKYRILNRFTKNFKF